MRRTVTRKTYPFIRWAFILFVALLAVYVPLKIYIARSDNAAPADGPDSITLSIFFTSELNGYREPCG